jgi:serine-type D-Ala-D-Ala carboxypeptidase (penicillin-binding protein 5/6)
VIAVLNGARTEKDRVDEAKKLIEYALHNFETRKLFAEGLVLGHARLFGGASRSVPLITEGPIDVLVPKNSNERIVARIVYSGPVPAPVTQGQKIGNLNVYRGETVIAEVPVFAAEDVATGTFAQRAIDGATEFVIGLFRRTNKKS